MSTSKLRSHGFYHQEYFGVEINHFWIKTCSGKFSAFTKQEETASSRSCRSWSASAEDYVMVRLNRRMYSVQYYKLSSQAIKIFFCWHFEYILASMLNVFLDV